MLNAAILSGERRVHTTERVGMAEDYNADWFNPENFDRYLKDFAGKPNIRFLEIGGFEGKGTNYFVRRFLSGENSKVVVIDPWIKYSESTVTKMEISLDDGKTVDELINEDTYEIFLKNTEENSQKIEIHRGLSKDILPGLNEGFDFIYVDGDHSRDAVWLDATMGFEKLKQGGVMVFDDYDWTGGKRWRGAAAKSPKKAVDRFMKDYTKEIDVL
jgi:hypothetical protein